VRRVRNSRIDSSSASRPTGASVLGSAVVIARVWRPTPHATSLRSRRRAGGGAARVGSTPHRRRPF
jgi:hypothetical protein